MGSHSLLQRIFPTQELNPCLLHWQVDSLSHLGSSISQGWLLTIVLPQVSLWTETGFCSFWTTLSPPLESHISSSYINISILQWYHSEQECKSGCVVSRVWVFVTLWSVACQAPLSMGFFQARILEWVTISYSRGSSRPRDRICTFLHLLHWQMDSLPLCQPGKPYHCERECKSCYCSWHRNWRIQQISQIRVVAKMRPPKNLW